MKLLVGLGNPGTKYEKNRHNIGFLALDEIALRSGMTFSPWRRKFQGGLAEGKDERGEKCFLLKPLTYMNESGRAVAEAARFYKIKPRDITVFHDELDLSPGKMKVKMGGGHAGHNGLRSIISLIGADFQRVRIGIGHPGRKELVSGYVLHDFAKADQKWMEDLLEGMARNIDSLILGDAPGFMSDVASFINPQRPSSGGRKPTAGTVLKSSRPKKGKSLKKPNEASSKQNGKQQPVPENTENNAEDSENNFMNILNSLKDKFNK